MSDISKLGLDPIGIIKPVKPTAPHARTPITKLVPVTADPTVNTDHTIIGAPIAPAQGVSTDHTTPTPVTSGQTVTTPHTKIGAPVTPQQQAALDRLHQATTQLEGVFLQMVMHEMSKSVPKDSVLGKQSSAEQTFSGMLDDERAKAIAQTGTLGISKVLDQQLRASVLADAANEAHGGDINRELER